MRNHRNHRQPEPQLWLCINPHCHRRWTEDQLGEIDWTKPEVFQRLIDWAGELPERGCKECGWPVHKLRVFIKDFALGMALGQEGMARAASAVTTEWFAAALGVVFHTAQRAVRPMTTDNLYPKVGDLDYLNNGKPVNMSALGHVMQTAAKLGWIERYCVDGVPQTKPGERIQHHTKALRMWRSLICD